MKSGDNISTDCFTATELPEGWLVRTAGDLGEFRGGGTPSTARSELWNGNIHWTTSKRIGESIEIPVGEKFISDLGLKESATSLIPRGNLIVGTRVGVGKTAVNQVDLAISQDLTGIIVDKNQFNPFFVAYQLREHRAQTIFATQNRGTTIKGIPREDLKQIELLTPFLPEQEKIAAVLWKIQKAVEIEHAIVRNARDLKKSLLRRLFTHGLRGEPLKETEIGALPESWELVPLGRIARIGNGSTPKRDNGSYWQRGTIAWLTSAKIYDGVIQHADEFVTDVAVRECHLPSVKPGSLLIAITGQGKTLGNAAVTAIETTISQHLAFAQFERSDVESNFMRFFFEGRYEHLRQIASGGGSTKGALTCGFLKTYPVPLPAKDEQREIADILQIVDCKIEAHESKKRSMQDLFKTMLYKLMTAQIRVNNLDIDTSEVSA